MSAELIYRRGSAPDAIYTFKHALVQDAAYSTLSRSRRQRFGSHVTVIEVAPRLIAREDEDVSGSGYHQRAAHMTLIAYAFLHHRPAEKMTDGRMQA